MEGWNGLSVAVVSSQVGGRRRWSKIGVDWGFLNKNGRGVVCFGGGLVYVWWAEGFKWAWVGWICICFWIWYWIIKTKGPFAL